MYKKNWIVAVVMSLSLTPIAAKGTDGREDPNPERTTEAMQANAQLVAKVLDFNSVGRFFAHGNAKVVKLFQKSEKMKKGLVPAHAGVSEPDSKISPNSASARESGWKWRGPDYSKM